MQELAQSFITSRQPYCKGEVFVFRQNFSASNNQRASLIMTAIVMPDGKKYDVTAGQYEFSVDIGGGHCDG